MLDNDLKKVGADWLVSEAAGITDEIIHVSPSQYNELTRFLPESVTPMPGYIRYDVNPYMREILDCADINSPVREVFLMKGVQITWTTLLESIMLYIIGHVKTLPAMYMTADKELASARVENNILPMINQSGMADLIRSSDEGNTRKSGKTTHHIQWSGGGYLVPFGARNADKMRSYSICFMLDDEIDAWPVTVGKDGDPHSLSDARTKAYTERRKIFKGSTPTIYGMSAIHKAYLRGDQRQYRVLCRKCNFPQELRWQHVNKETGLIGGFQWDMDGRALVRESVRYCCQSCGAEHFEHDKERLFSPADGAHWHPTAQPAEPDIRSYHLPALYSPIGMQPWHKCVSEYLEAYDVEKRNVRDIPAYQVWYNNVLAWPFKVLGLKVSIIQASAHRREVYKFGEVPNAYAEKYSGSGILCVTCQVDVHKRNLAVAVFGWCRDARPYVLDYWRFETEGEDSDCADVKNPVWDRLRKLVEEKEYVSADNKIYRIALTFVDAGYCNDTVVKFCADYEGGVYPILGRSRPAKNATIKEFSQFTTQDGTIGYKLNVDHYKDRIAPILRRSWTEDDGVQGSYHFNAPIDITDDQLTELTVETRIQKTDDNGALVYVWHRPSGSKNELWDLCVYGYAAIEVIAWGICVDHFELKNVDWPVFWNYLEQEAPFFKNKLT